MVSFVKTSNEGDVSRANNVMEAALLRSDSRAGMGVAKGKKKHRYYCPECCEHRVLLWLAKIFLVLGTVTNSGGLVNLHTVIIIDVLAY